MMRVMQVYVGSVGSLVMTALDLASLVDKIPFVKSLPTRQRNLVMGNVFDILVAGGSAAVGNPFSVEQAVRDAAERLSGLIVDKMYEGFGE